jgi:hypothetical protein
VGPLGRWAGPLGLRWLRGPPSSACDRQSLATRAGGQAPVRWSSSIAANVWVVVESAEGSLVASSE